MLNVITGNLLGSDAKYICHQCNCLTTRAAGVAAQIFKEFPWANVYKDRVHGIKPDERMGDIVVCGDGKKERYVVNMLSQYYPGISKRLDDERDGKAARQMAFADCLLKISSISDLTSIAFPWGIGCGMAGGDWGWYLSMLEGFASTVDADVSLCRL